MFNFENLICPSDDYPNDMAAIEFMSNSRDLKHLLEHPLIASFLFVKWNRLALIFCESDILSYKNRPFVFSSKFICNSFHFSFS